MAHQSRGQERSALVRTELGEQRRSLSPREIEVLTWVARGKSASKIAAILRISKRTIDEHARAAGSKLGAVNRTHAVAIAIRDQLIQL